MICWCKSLPLKVWKAWTIYTVSENYIIYTWFTQKKNLQMAQDRSIQKSEYAKHKEHDAWGAVQLCSYSVSVWWEEDTLFCSQLIEATYRGLS